MISVLTGVNDLTIDATVAIGQTVTLTKPTATADGDLLVAVVTFQNANVAPVITPPASGTWTKVGPALQNNPYRGMAIYVMPVPVAANVSDTSWTWTTNTSSGRRRGMLFRVTGADLSTPEDAFGGWSPADNTTSIVIPQVTTTYTNSVVIAAGYTQSTAVQGNASFTPPGSMTTITTVNTAPGSANTGLWAGYETVSPGATGTRTISLSPAATATGGFMLALKAAGSTPAPVLVHNINGVVTDSSFQIAFKASNVASGVRAAISTAADLSSPTYTSSVLPDADGYGRITVAGLNADTVYYWGLEIDGTLSPSYHGKTRTFPPAGSQASFSFTAASCINTGDNPTTLDNMRSRIGPDGVGARFFGHLGDFHYVYSTGGGNPIAPTDQAVLRENFTNQIAVSRQHQIFREMPLSYTWSDVDSFGSNGDGTYAANPYANAAYRQVFPIPADMPATTGIYRSWVIGRIRFIQMDQRTFSSARGAADNSSKTKLGSVQKAWMLNLIQTAPEKVIVLLGDSAWYGASNVSGTNDSWSAYNNERTQIGAAIAASGKNCIMIHGDVHALAADDGSNNQWGGFPVICAAPMSRPDMAPWPTGSGWAQSNGSYPLASQAGTAYGWFDISDTGNHISLDFSGYNANVEQVSMLVRWFTGRYKKGNGIKLTPYVKISGSLVELQ